VKSNRITVFRGSKNNPSGSTRLPRPAEQPNHQCEPFMILNMNAPLVTNLLHSICVRSEEDEVNDEPTSRAFPRVSDYRDTANCKIYATR